MKWGLLPLYNDANISLNNDAFVYFTGSKKDTIVGLGGSKKHLIPTDIKEGPDASHLPILVESLQKGQKKVMENELPSQSGALQINDAALASVHEIDKNWRAPTSQLKFLAINFMHNKIQLHDMYGRTSAILGSPLYVYQI
jgi:hypothetical protein